MGNDLIISHEGNTLEEVVQGINKGNPGLMLFFYGASHDYKALEKKLMPLNVPFLGCMDAGRFVTGKYLLDEKSIVGMSISSEIIEAIEINTVDCSSSRSRDDIRKESKQKFLEAAKKVSIDLNNPDMERDLAINIVFGLNSATPFLEGQSEAGLMLQTVGGSSGGRTDFIETNIISSAGSGHLGAFALLRLHKSYKFIMDRVSSFDPKADKTLTVTKLENPRHILEMNGKPATHAYSEALGIDSNSLSPESFAHYTLGIDPGDGERLITSIMKTDDATGLLTYNDVISGTQFKLYKAISQEKERSKHISGKLKSKNIVGYISFDCILCYIARNTLKEVHKIAEMYEAHLPGIPKIGFSTFSENICGANVNQTETYLAIIKA
ncbi:MAG: FIST C-terminal domain-containing protein [Spirochaetales bacterium]|nr:FIST C-terminal domain-containing protein [Spirochaetales bacterium]